MTRVLILVAVAVILGATSASAACTGWKHCEPLITGPKKYDLLNDRRQKVGDLYDPGHNRRLQIRDNNRRIIGYIERDGTVTNRSRQEVLSIESILESQ